MELKPSYKHTEVGVIPEDWEVSSIGDLAFFKSGDGISIGSLAEESADASIPVYGGNGIAGYTDKALVWEPVVVVGRVGQRCGEVHLTGGPAWITDNALYPWLLRRQIDLRFLTLALKAAGLNSVKNRNDLPLVTQSILHSVRIPVPPTRTEEEAIAEALSDADDLIKSLEQLLLKKHHVKQGAMQELLTPRKHLPGFGRRWRATRLGELGVFLKGSGVTKDEAQSGDLACVRYGEIYTQHNYYIKAFYSWISSDVAREATRLKQGDILFAGSGETKDEIGKCVAYVNDNEAYAGGDIVILRTKGADPLFLGYYLNSEPINQQKASKGQGDAVVHINSGALEEILVTVPSIPEQTAIATVLSDMDAEIDALEAKLTKARQIKQGMMQELLTGRIRLV